MSMPEPCYDIAHLGHVEMFTNKPEASLDFFVNILGLTASGTEGDSVYLRAWDDHKFHTLKLTASNTTGVGHWAIARPALRHWSTGSRPSRRWVRASAGAREISATAPPTASGIRTGTFSRSITTPLAKCRRNRKSRP